MNSEQEIIEIYRRSEIRVAAALVKAGEVSVEEIKQAVAAGVLNERVLAALPEV